METYEEKLKTMEEQLSKVQIQLEVVRNVGEKDKYKTLARRLKDERNHLKDMVDKKKAEQEQDDLDVLFAPKKKW